MRSSSWTISTGRLSKYERRTSSAPSGSAPGRVDLRGPTASAIGWSKENTNARARPQHAVHLAEQPVEVLDLAEHAGREREVDRVGAQEREVGRVALVPLDAHLGGRRELAGPRELRGRAVDRDDVRALAGERDRVLARAASRGRGPACR